MAAVILFAAQLVAYSRSRAALPLGLQIGGVPVGGLGREQALAQVANIYSAPVELRYQEFVIVLAPETVGFRLDTEAILAGADQLRTEDPFWSGFWDYLWRLPGQVQSIPVRADYSEEQLRQYLEDVAARYDRSPSPVQPQTSTLSFAPGAPGHWLEVESSMSLVAAALYRSADRQAELTLAQGDVSRPSFEALELLLKQHIAENGFPGLVDLAVIDLHTGAELHLNHMQGRDYADLPDIAFAGMDLMKIPIVLETLRQEVAPTSAELDQLLGETIELSGNDKANLLLQRVGKGDGAAGAAAVTDSLRRLGLLDSFLAGMYDQADPPPRISTAANQREDIHTAPDVLMQTTPTDIAFLLLSLYQCASGTGGALQAVFPSEITPEECEFVLETLSRNRIGVLIEAGVPDGTRVAHKQGWIGTTNGDAGIVYSPGGDYVLVVFLWQSDYLSWEVSSPLIADISRAVYNYFNVTGR